MAELVNFLIDIGVFFDIGVGAGDIRFWLVVVVIRHKIFDGVVRKEFFELRVELGGQRFVVGEYQSRPAVLLDEIRHGEGLARTGHAEQHLAFEIGVEAIGKQLDRAGLIAGGTEVTFDAEICQGDDLRNQIR